jgi:hypothetical protein
MHRSSIMRGAALFPGAPMSVVAMEAAKLITVGGLPGAGGSRPRLTAASSSPWLPGLPVIKATGVYGQLVAAPVGDRGAPRWWQRHRAQPLRPEVAAHTVGDLDRG